MDYKKWTEEAIWIINTKLQKGDVFELKSLFPKYKWDKLLAKEKRAFGRYFANEIRDKGINNVKSVEKGKDNHCKYMKI